MSLICKCTKRAVTVLPFQPALLPSYPHWKRKFNFAKSIYASMYHWNFKSLSNDHELSRIDLWSVIFVRQKRVFFYYYYFFFFYCNCCRWETGEQTLITLSQNLVKYEKEILGCWNFHFSPKKTLIHINYYSTRVIRVFLFSTTTVYPY